MAQGLFNGSTGNPKHGTLNPKPEYSRNKGDYKDLGKYVPIMFLLYFWGSLFGSTEALLPRTPKGPKNEAPPPKMNPLLHCGNQGFLGDSILGCVHVLQARREGKGLNAGLILARGGAP